MVKLQAPAFFKFLLDDERISIRQPSDEQAARVALTLALIEFFEKKPLGKNEQSALSAEDRATIVAAATRHWDTARYLICVEINGQIRDDRVLKKLAGDIVEAAKRS